MYTLERWSSALRHCRWVENADWLWDRVRPAYDKMIGILGRNGLKRAINGTDQMLILPRFRGMPERYEPDVWTNLIMHVQRNDLVADVGAFIGLYTVALAKRCGPAGKVVAFEPDPENFQALQAHIELNGVRDHVELIEAAVGEQDGILSFESGKSSESRIAASGRMRVRCVRLDSIFADRPMNILKIDVEGYEEAALKGALGLLRDPRRCPRRIYLEVHPYAWPELGTTSESVLRLLAECGYRVSRLDGQTVEHIDSWGEIVAHKTC